MSVRERNDMAPVLQVVALGQLPVVVDLPVVDDHDRAVLVGHGLVPRPGSGR